MRHQALLMVLSIFGVVLFSACGDEGLFSASKPALAPTTVAPTFVVITVTPGPTASPVPTLVPTPARQLSAVELADPVFPSELDPDTNSTKPEDEVIFEGWRQFLGNSEVFIDGFSSGTDLCEDRVLSRWLSSRGNKAEWYVARSADMSTSEWGDVEIRSRVTDGTDKGIDSRLIQVSRADGKFWDMNSDPPREYEFKRSQKCLDLITVVDYSNLARLSDPVFPDGLEPEIFGVDFFDPETGKDQPSEQFVYGGWTEFLTNASVWSEDAVTTWHLCEDGVVLNDDGPDPIRQNWFVGRSPEISEDDWGSVAVRVGVVSGRWEGREFTLLLLTRVHGRTYVTNTISPSEVEITRSKECLALEE